ncbi:3-hydroxyacyl-CoA dehydrogenase family protein [Sporobolomyces salmoneus]|uniref:3-hydroxyacyl-CoA dehydrogenase family protein n=1 Tax=Sporobolomyces salmoneus TaxID=183962 RepID=UPI003177CBF5
MLNSTRVLSARPLISSSSSRSFPHTFRRTFSSSPSSRGAIKSIGVIGSGQMGVGIAYVAARTAGVQVQLCDTNSSQLETGVEFMHGLLGKEYKKGKITEEEIELVKKRISTVGGIKEFGGENGVDLAIEAVSENLKVKQTIFGELATHLKPASILASNTSSISLSKLAASAVSKETGEDRSRSVVGFHFFNPVPVMKLVELIPALQTHPLVLKIARSIALEMGKTVVVSRDSPGFISNRLLMPYINEAVEVLESGVAKREDIDQTMKLGMNHPMGPLTLADFIGLDTCLSIMQVLYTETGDSKYRPSVLLSRMVSAGYMGKKSGKGFYDYGSAQGEEKPIAIPGQEVEGEGRDTETPAPYGESETRA